MGQVLLMPDQTPPRARSLALARPAFSAQASRDRLSSTLFLAALFHGILILGVTFTVIPPDNRRAPTSLDVVLVTRDYERLAASDDARLLATGNLTGQGNAPLSEELRTALTTAEPLLLPGPDRPGEGIDPSDAGTRQPAQELLTALGDMPGRVLPDRTGAERSAARQQPLPVGAMPASDIIADPDSRTVIPDLQPREVAVSANTREARIASYLNNWKTKVERIGTLNFPRAAWLQGIDKHPIVEVAITASGDLREVVVRGSSGDRALDQAAVDIVHLAAPFEPFSAALREDYDVVRFAYEWHFNAGVASGRLTAIGGS
jgi:protein TonB